MRQVRLEVSDTVRVLLHHVHRPMLVLLLPGRVLLVLHVVCLHGGGELLRRDLGSLGAAPEGGLLGLDLQQFAFQLLRNVHILLLSKGTSTL